MREQELAFPSTALLLSDEDLAERPGVLLGLHGYTGTAAGMAALLRPVADACGWALACPEAPHCFYPKRPHARTGCSWMTSHRRQALIANNVAWLRTALAQVRRHNAGPIIVIGFSQGASQAWRLVWQAEVRLAGIAAVGGDIPPELREGSAPDAPPSALLVRGRHDELYTVEHVQTDRLALTALQWKHEVALPEAGHELNDAVCETLVQWIRARDQAWWGGFGS